MNFSKKRLIQFTDGVASIIITIMVLSIPLPKNLGMSQITEFLISILIYLLSFIVVGSFWSRHHRLFTYIETVTNKVIWINILFLFFLSLIPTFTKWVIENPGQLVPAIGYNFIYLLSSLSYMFIFRFVIHNSEHDHIKELRDTRTDAKRPKDMPGRGFWLRMAGTVVAVAAIVLLSVLLPVVSTFFLLGMPVVFSIVNLFFDDYKREHRQKKILEVVENSDNQGADR